MHDEIEVRLAIKIPEKVRQDLRALKHQREMEEGRPVREGEILSELVERAARESVSRG